MTDTDTVVGTCTRTHTGKKLTAGETGKTHDQDTDASKQVITAAQCFARWRNKVMTDINTQGELQSIKF